MTGHATYHSPLVQVAPMYPPLSPWTALDTAKLRMQPDQNHFQRAAYQTPDENAQSDAATIATLQADNYRLQNDLQTCQAMLAGTTVTTNNAHAVAYAPSRHQCGVMTKAGTPCRRTGRCPFHATYMEPI